MYGLTLVVACTLFLSVMAFFPTRHNEVRVNSMETFAKHGKKRWIELGYRGIDESKDKSKWEESKKRWEAMGGKPKERAEAPKE